MKAEIIAVGTEILTGQIINTNAQFLSENRLLSILEIAKKRSDLVILCGGLGPTEDDLTKQVLAKFLNRRLVFDQVAMEKLDRFFASRLDYVRTPNNERQAQIVEDSTSLQNETGLAVGGVIEVSGVTYVVLPGPPSELKPMVNNELIPILATDQKLYSRVLRFFGIGESQLVTLLGDLIDAQIDPTIAPYAKTGEVTLRLSTKASSQKEADTKFAYLEKKILAVQTFEKQRLVDLFYAYGDDNSLAQTTFELLRRAGKTVTAAESLTAGLFQATLANFSGASKVFSGGFVTYSMEEKSRMLDIPLADLEKYGVVSAFTAKKMAEQARKLTASDYAVSLTGVAGPDSLEGYPAGTVYIGLATTENVQSFKVNIAGRSRTDVRKIAVLHAFNQLRKTLLKNENML